MPDAPLTAEPSHIQINPLADGLWGWDVWYLDNNFDQNGKAKSLDEALECVKGLIENGRTKP